METRAGMTKDQCERLCDTLRYVFVSPNVCDSNFEAANLVDATANLANGAFAVARAITPKASPGVGADGTGHIESLTEAVMDMSCSLLRIAEAIGDVASALRESGSNQ
jgi:hypothetical protein